MPNLNKVLLMGNLTRDPELRFLPSGTAVVQFGIATNRRFKNAAGDFQEETTFVDVEMFGRRAEVIKDYVHKGDPLFVEGRLKLDEWEAKDGSGKRRKLKVICESFEFISSRRDSGGGGGSGGGGSSSSGRSAPAEPAEPAERASGADEAYDGDDEIPF